MRRHDSGDPRSRRSSPSKCGFGLRPLSGAACAELCVMAARQDYDAITRHSPVGSRRATSRTCLSDASAAFMYSLWREHSSQVQTSACNKARMRAWYRCVCQCVQRTVADATRRCATSVVRPLQAPDQVPRALLCGARERPRQQQLRGDAIVLRHRRDGQHAAPHLHLPGTQDCWWQGGFADSVALRKVLATAAVRDGMCTKC